MKKKRKIASGIVIGTAIFLLAVGCYLFFGTVPIQKEIAGNSGTDWMAELSDEMLLNEITIPGAHDSCAWNSDFAYFSQCQSSDTAVQLQMGIRYLDIRISLNQKESALIMTHSIAVCREGGLPFSKVLTLEKVLDDCYDFLREHPAETVVFCVKPEDNQEKCLELLKKAIQEKPKLWYVEDQIPALGAVRGKLVLASRFTQETDGMGILLQWPEQDNTEILEEPFSVTETENGVLLYVQDRYCYETEAKWDAFCYGLNQKTGEINWEKDILLQFLSTKGSRSLGHPLRYAKILNGWLMDQSLKKGSNGWIIVDFAKPELVRHIYETNFADTPN